MLAYRKNRRFSLLSLEEGEIYYEDFACTYSLSSTHSPDRSSSNRSSTSQIASIEGRLHLLSASLIFQPDSVKYPITRLPLDKIDIIECGGRQIATRLERNGASSRELMRVLLGRNMAPSTQSASHTSPNASIASLLDNCIHINSNLLVEFKKHNKNQPYRTKKGSFDILLEFKYGRAREIVEKVVPVAELWIGNVQRSDEGHSNATAGAVIISRYQFNEQDSARASPGGAIPSNTSSKSNASKSGSWWSSTFGFGSKNSSSGSATHRKNNPPSRKRAISSTTATLNKGRIIEELCSRFEQHMHTSKFDESWIEDFREEVKCEFNSHRVTPLVDQAGRLLLTQKRLYFQPFDKISSKPVKKYDLSQIYCIVKRRRLLRHIGLEIFLKNDKSLFFTFENTEQRNTVHDEMTKLGVKRLKSSMSEMTLQWQKGNISNFDYLLYLNFMADRTFNDLSQYPVFPWIIKDYTSSELNLDSPDTFRDLSKPIGALNPQAFQSLLKRYEEMPRPKFLYGTHYSSEAYVLYYLVRQIPEYMLRLQNGKFDAPDRMFHSLSETWNSIMENASDVKELLPEFYHSTANFLRNTEALNLGTRQNNQKVNHVLLPPWCHNDPQQFVYLNRMALESEHVSAQLHRWIDLIFGYKQTGEEAEKAHNVFHYLSYEGGVDIDSIHDPLQKRAIESQIKSFGQTPKQLFKKPHPPRLVPKSKNLPTYNQVVSSDVIPLDPILNAVHRASAYDSMETSSSSVQQNSSYSPSGSNLKSPIISDDAPLPSFVPSFSTLMSQNNALDGTTLTEVANPEYSDTATPQSNPTDTLPSVPPSSVNRFDFDTLSCTFRNALHRDSITSCFLNEECTKIYTASHDATAKVFSVKHQRQTRRLTGMGDMALSSCFLLNNVKEETVALSSYNNNIYVYSSAYGRILDSIAGHEDAISQMRQHKDQLISGSYDCTVKIWKNNGHGVLEKVPVWQFCEHDTEVNCVNFERSANNLACSGSMDGDLIVYDLRSGKSVYDLTVHDGSSVQDCWFVPGDETRILTVGKDGCIKTTQINVGEVECIQNSQAADAGGLLCMDIVDDNHYVVGAGNGIVYAYRYNDSKLMAEYNLFDCAVTSVYVGKNAIAVGGDNGEICLLKEKGVG
eukprot:CAMPEP_0117448702 /NCGR_PEP_ID=MMETSP0759-20121206/7545_1 /TAXON_ID=63605 /ORGANISM="Percolomonas cosmopolitus, Strain WS" /LENGTH=1131 /DNA_ID=CAMNT_0005241113 /DNA_START=176 /DNA_END=3571 /DNA_ORIENTATION=+